MVFAEQVIETLNKLPPDKQAEIIDFAEFVAKKYQKLSQSESFVEQNELTTKLMSETARRPKYKLSELLAEMPETLPMVEGWDEIPSEYTREMLGSGVRGKYYEAYSAL